MYSKSAILEGVNIKEGIVNNTIWFVCSVAITLAFLYLTAPPYTEEILVGKLKDEIKARYYREEGFYVDSLSIDKGYSSEIGMLPKKSSFLSGCIKSRGKNYRWIAIYERREPNILDKIVGRSGSYKIPVSGHIESNRCGQVYPRSIEKIDMDQNGRYELHISFRVRTMFEQLNTRLIAKKDISGRWHPINIKSIAMDMSDRNFKEQPTVFLSSKNIEEKISAETKKYFEDYEEGNIKINIHGGSTRKMVLSRNEDGFEIKKHDILGYKMLRVYSSFDEIIKIKGEEYVVKVINMIHMEDNRLVQEINWNKGKPLILVENVDSSNKLEIHDYGYRLHKRMDGGKPVPGYPIKTYDTYQGTINSYSKVSGR